MILPRHFHQPVIQLQIHSGFWLQCLLQHTYFDVRFCRIAWGLLSYQTINGGIQRYESIRWIHDIPSTHRIQTDTVMIMTPPHAGKVPLESAAKQEAPEIALMAFQPVVETIENTTTSKLPQ